jgi:hypothetical protein
VHGSRISKNRAKYRFSAGRESGPVSDGPLRVTTTTLLIKTQRDQISLELPRPIIERLDEVLKRALTDAGHGQVPRHLLVGALLFSAAADGDVLYDLIKAYRNATVGDALPATAEVLDLPRRRVGRPRHT